MVQRSDAKQPADGGDGERRLKPSQAVQALVAWADSHQRLERRPATEGVAVAYGVVGGGPLVWRGCTGGPGGARIEVLPGAGVGLVPRPAWARLVAELTPLLASPPRPDTLTLTVAPARLRRNRDLERFGRAVNALLRELAAAGPVAG